MSSTRFFVGATASLSLGLLLACAPAPLSSGSDERDGGSSGGGTGGYDDPGVGTDAGLAPDSACAEEGAEATLTREPVDVVLVVDNSASMRPQIESVQRVINTHFAKVLDDHKLDYRVIVVGMHGDYKSANNSPICIEAPLSGIPAGGCDNPPATPAYNPPKFFHYSYRIRNNDAFQILFHGFDEPDELATATNGWSEWLRKDAFKSFVVLTDGRVNFAYDGVTYSDGNHVDHAVTTAAKLDDKLRSLSSEHFGDAGEARKYRFYSIVSMAPNEPPTDPYPQSDPLVVETCSSSDVNAGLGYQALSRLTGGARFPLCNPGDFDAIFRTIARDLISGSPVECEFPIPEPPPGEVLDLKRVAVQYQPSGSEPPSLFGPVDDAAACVPNGFYIQGDQVHLCPETCELVQGDDAAKVSVLFDCQVILR